ncbi:MAG: SMR family transporter [Rubritepida sp.]|jgi:multidrug transporter EmrE-like cation transporter|nr:SMR family transporter [Rubritepida sp.]MCU0944755.1 SMR family transporter [Rubritepida sp.]
MSLHWLALGAAIGSSLIGQVLLKAGADAAGAASFLSQLLRWQTVVGIGFYGAGALLYILALRKIPMSVALPCTAASYVLIALIGWWFFAEPLGAQKLAAIAFIAAGVVLLATA